MDEHDARHHSRMVSGHLTAGLCTGPREHLQNAQEREKEKKKKEGRKKRKKEKKSQCLKHHSRILLSRPSSLDLMVSPTSTRLDYHRPFFQIESQTSGTQSLPLKSLSNISANLWYHGLACSFANLQRAAVDLHDAQPSHSKLPLNRTHP